MAIDKETLEFVSDLSDLEETAFDLHDKRWKAITDTAALKNYTPEQLIRAARTQEELFSVRRFLLQQDAALGITGGQPWWGVYGSRKTDLGHQISYFGEGRFVVPLAPEPYVKNPYVSGHQRNAVQRNVHGGFVGIQQAQGLEPISIMKPGKTKVPVPKMNKAYIFDLETTGLLKGESNILSLGAHSEGATVEHYTLLKEFGENKQYSSFIRNQQIPQYEKGLAAFIKAGGKTSTEKELVLQFISEATPGRVISGYNIKKFDIPMMFEAAERYGLHHKLKKALSKTEIIDVAESVIPYLQEKLGGVVVGWEEGMTKQLGLSPRGWKLGAVARGFGVVSAEELAKSGHLSGFDARMTALVAEALEKDKDFNIKAFAETVEELSGTKLKFYSDLVDESGQLFAPKSKVIRTEEYYSRPLQDVLAEKYGPATKTPASTVKPQLGRAIGEIATDEALDGSIQKKIASRLFSEFPSEIKEARILRNKAVSKFKGFTPRGKVGLGLGAAAVGLGFFALGSRPETRSQERFNDSGVSKFISSGGKYDFNTIEGLHPGSDGMGARSIFGGSDFGSGYKGLPGQLMGQPIDMRVLKFRSDIWDDPQKKAELQHEIKVKEAIAQEKMGSFTKNQLQAFMTVGLEGINTQRNLEAVDLSQFKMRVEDADTLVLEQSDGKNVMIRLAGIDAPETAGHANDPMESLRIEQEQPYGQEAADRLRDILAEQSNVQLLIDKSQKTYGRYIGTLVGDRGSNINIQLAREGMVGALPFGPESKDVVLRSQVATAQQEARAEDRGMWQYARYRAQALAEAQTGQAITQNTLTVLDRLGKNLNLGAYFSFLESFDDSKRNLSIKEMHMAEQMGRVLKSSHGGNRRKKFNSTDGLHPGSEGMGAQTMRAHSNFGSGWTGDFLAVFTKDKREIVNRIKEGYDESKEEENRIATVKALNALGRKVPESLSVAVKKDEAQDEYGFLKGSNKLSMKFLGHSLTMRDKYNEMDGLHPKQKDSMGAKKVQEVSDFGSGWDPLKTFAKSVFGGTEEKAFKRLIKSKQFQSALGQGLKNKTLLGEGAQGGVYSSQASLSMGKHWWSKKQKIDFSFASKTMDADKGKLEAFRAFEKEKEALGALGDLNVPSLYGTGEKHGLRNTVIMEQFEGAAGINTKGDLSLKEYQGLRSSVEEFHSRGLSHSDLQNPENIMRVSNPRTGGEEIGVIDWGNANRFIDEGQKLSSEENMVLNFYKKKHGKDITMQDYSRIGDLEAIKGHVSGVTKTQASYGVNTFLQAENASRGAERAAKQVSLAEDLFKQINKQGISENNNLALAEVQGAKADFSGKFKKANVWRDRLKGALSSATEDVYALGIKSRPSEVAELMAFGKSNKSLTGRALQGTHPGVGTNESSMSASMIREFTDFGAGSKIAKKLFSEIAEIVGKGSDDVVGTLAKRHNIKIIKNKSEYLDIVTKKRLKIEGRPASDYKKIYGLEEGSIDELGAYAVDNNTIFSPDKGSALAEMMEKQGLVTFKNNKAQAQFAKEANDFSTIHEILEVLHARKLGKGQMTSTGEFGGHITKQVIEDEAFLAFSRGKDSFNYASKVRSIESEGIRSMESLSSEFKEYGKASQNIYSRAIKEGEETLAEMGLNRLDAKGIAPKRGSISKKVSDLFKKRKKIETKMPDPPSPPAPVDTTPHPFAQRAKEKRQRAFRTGSQLSVGTGLRSAHGGASRHGRYASTRNGGFN